MRLIGALRSALRAHTRSVEAETAFGALRPALRAHTRSVVRIVAVAAALCSVGSLGGCDRPEKGTKGPLSESDVTLGPDKSQVTDAPDTGALGIPTEERTRIFRARLVSSTLPPPTLDGRGRPLPGPTSLRTFSTEATSGGAHHAMLVHRDHWVQSLGTTVLVLDPRSARRIGSIDVAPPGIVGPIVDMLIDGDSLLVVMERDAVVEVVVGGGGLPIVRSIRLAEELGVTPRRLTRAGGDVWIFGEGGAVRWRDGYRPPGGDEFVTGIASCGGRLALVRNRRVIWADEGVSRHAATTLRELPPESGAAAVLVMQTANAARVALLDGELAELDAEVIEGLVRRIRHRDGRLWAITDDAIHHWTVEGGALGERESIPVRGARDVARVGPNRLAVSGSFGRSLYREEQERGNPGDEFLAATREASRLTMAVTDGRRILAGGREGRWLYLIGGQAEMTDKILESRTPAPPVAKSKWGPASISDDYRAVRLGADGVEVRPFDGSLVSTVAEIDGEIWIGHENGIDLVGVDEDGDPFIEARLRLDGPVVAIYQKWDGGGAYVAEYGGFGVARLVDTPLHELGLAPAPTGVDLGDDGARP